MKKSSTIFLQIFIVLIAVTALAFLLWEPTIEGRNVHATLSEIYFKDPFLAFAYIGSISFFVVLYQVFKLLRYVRENMYFSAKSARALRTIKCCALIIIGFVVAGEISILLNHGNDDPAGGIFMGILITLVALVTISLVTRFERRLQLKMEK